MPSMRYQVSIALTKTDFERLRKLQKAEFKVIEIFRNGLNATEETHSTQTSTKQEGTR